MDAHTHPRLTGRPPMEGSNAAGCLRSVFAMHGIERCAFLMLDCEGAEWEIVRRSPRPETVPSSTVWAHDG